MGKGRGERWEGTGRGGEEDREREGMEEGRGNGRDGTGHGMGRGKGKGMETEERGLQPPNFNSWRRHWSSCLTAFSTGPSTAVAGFSDVCGGVARLVKTYIFFTKGDFKVFKGFNLQMPDTKLRPTSKDLAM